MLRALGVAESTPEQMAELAKGRLRRKLVQLQLALEGRVEEHHRFLLNLQLRQLDQLEANLSLLDARIEEKLAPFREQRELLKEIPASTRFSLLPSSPRLAWT